MSEPRLPLLPVSPSGEGIPPILHRIWVGGEPPAWVIDSWMRWNDFLAESGHEWEIETWTDLSIEGTPLERIAAAKPGWCRRLRASRVKRRAAKHDRRPLCRLRPC